MSENKFVDAAKLYSTANATMTENGAYALKSTGSHLLDLYGTAGGLRNATNDRIFKLFDDAVADDALLAAKLLFYIRDIREGLGERDLARRLMKYAAHNYPQLIKDNIHLIGEYGRYDDLYLFLDTPLENDMWKYMKETFENDLMALSNENIPVSLLAKWMKTADASSKNTRYIGIQTAIHLGYANDIPTFKRLVRLLRKRINIVEAKMSANEWDKIEYSHVPSRASMIYRNAFSKHDTERYKQYINDALEGNATIHAATLTPYDLIREVMYGSEKDDTIEAQWKQLPDYVDSDTNVLCMVDVSGSMRGRPMDVAVGLGMYFAEHNTGAFNNLFMTFSEIPEIVVLEGETLYERVSNMMRANWGYTTDLKAAFTKCLDIALKHNVPAEDMPKSIIVISDMEINKADNRGWLFYDVVAEEYKKAGYKIPNLIFWNVKSRNTLFHVDSDRAGVQLASGESATIFKQVIANIGFNPIEAMLRTLNSERYAAVKLSDE